MYLDSGLVINNKSCSVFQMDLAFRSIKCYTESNNQVNIGSMVYLPLFF